MAYHPIRFFISSTLRDLNVERDLLVRFVFPELRERCAARKLLLVDVDLRWGVLEEETEGPGILHTCLDEIDRCRPFFVGLLADRYGGFRQLTKSQTKQGLTGSEKLSRVSPSLRLKFTTACCATLR